MRIHLSILALCISFSVYAQQNLNALLSTYSSNIKVCNAPHANSCIYKTYSMRATKSGTSLTIEYDFEDITSNKIVIDLKSASFYTGWWSQTSGKWEQYGDKKVLTIKDDNGIDLFTRGLRNYNQGTKQNLISSICFDLGTIPVANRVLTELLGLQNGLKEKDPWLLPVPEPAHTVEQPQNRNTQQTSKSTRTKRATLPKKQEPRKSKSGRYGE
ncbi:MAG: hypothetical protein J6W52_13160 [Bacteroidaceae bacterium]|nr:hypothetical protein [Bacteroidaceae bacterium]